jgi:hypothetical protein
VVEVLAFYVLGSRYSGMFVVTECHVLEVQCALGFLERRQHQG